MNRFAYGLLRSPLGVFYVVCDGDALYESGFERSEARARARLSGRYGAARSRDPLVRESLGQTRAYFARRLRRFDLPLAPQGTPFQQEVWRTVAQLEVGMLVSYADVARAVGRPLAHRGVAQAMCKTPLSLFIPAHRVIGADGRIKGERSEATMRRKLLAFEGIRLPR